MFKDTYAGLRREPAATRLLGLRVRIPQRARIFVSWECCVCQAELSASDWSLVQRSSTECGLSWVRSWSLD